MDYKTMLRLMQAHPDASDEELLALAQSAQSAPPPPRTEPGMLSRVWEWANTPLADVDFGESTLGRLGEGFVEGLSSPVGLGLTLAAPAAGLARSAGLTGASKALQLGDLGLNALLGLEGAKNLGQGIAEENYGQALAGGVQALGGAWGGRQAAKGLDLPGRAFAGDMGGEVGAVRLAKPPVAPPDWADEAFAGAQQGGFTFRPDRGNLFGQPYTVVSLPAAERAFAPGASLGPDAIRKFAQQYEPYLAKDPSLTVGGWVADAASQRYAPGSLVLNLGRLVDDEAYAAKLSGVLGEEGAFNLGTGAFVGSAPMAKRFPKAWRAKTLDEQLRLFEQGPMALEHRSSRPGLTTLDPKFYGTGYRGAEAKRQAAWPSAWINRSYATVKDGLVEDTIRKFRHTYDLDVPGALIYDGTRDADGLIEEAMKRTGRYGWPGDQRLGANLFEKIARDRGYAGVRFPSSSGKSTHAGEDTVELFDAWAMTPRQLAQDQAAKASRGLRGPTTAASFAMPMAAQGIEDDPDTQLDDYARLGLNLAGAAGIGMVMGKGLTKGLAAEIKAIIKSMGKFEGQGKTKAREMLRKRFGDEKAAVIFRQFEATDLPEGPFVAQGINLRDRRPFKDLFTKDAEQKNLLGLKPTVKRRLDALYDYAGTLDANWDDSDTLLKVFGDEQTLWTFANLFGALSPSAHLKPNTLGALESFVRLRGGEETRQVASSLRMPPAKGVQNVLPNFRRTVAGLELSGDKVRALAQAITGNKNGIPLDIHFLRALGALEEKAPSVRVYAQAVEAIAKHAAHRGITPFDYMARIWGAMRHITNGDAGGGISQMLKQAGVIGDDAVQPSLFTGNAVERVPGKPVLPVQTMYDNLYPPKTKPVPVPDDLQTVWEAPLPLKVRGPGPGLDAPAFRGFAGLVGKPAKSRPSPAVAADTDLAQAIADWLQGRPLSL